MTKSILLGEGLLVAAIVVYDAIMQALLGLIVSLPQLPDGCVGLDLEARGIVFLDSEE